MTQALFTFMQMVAWTALFLGTFAVLMITFARAAESDIEAAMSKAKGETWRSRIPFFVVAALGAMWLYASWGTG